MILMCLINILVSPIYIDTLVLYNGRSLPTFVNLSIVSEYDQEIQQSQTADKPMAPRGRATQQPANHMAKIISVLLDFSLTVKAATLMLISGRGLAMSSA